LKPLTHRSLIIVPPSSPQKAVSIDEFIEQEKGQVSADDLLALRSRTSALREKAACEQALPHHDLVAGIDLLIRLIESIEVDQCVEPLPGHLAEAVVAANYILKGVDFIPDAIPEIGLVDDARICARVLERNPSLRSYG
jgi:hypothetical protein